MAKDGVVLLKSADQETLFEYRWKSEWSVAHYICTVEIRPISATDQTRFIPEVVVGSFPNSHTQQLQMYREHDVPIRGKLAHSNLSPTDCGKVAGVYAGLRQ
jgi:hypothetical protein